MENRKTGSFYYPWSGNKLSNVRSFIILRPGKETMHGIGRMYATACCNGIIVLQTGTLPTKLAGRHNVMLPF